MASPVIMPQLGETVAEGKILSWFKAVGDDVKVGDKLFEVETDKVTVEVEAIISGKLSEIQVGAGITANVGTTVAVIEGVQAPPQDRARPQPHPASLSAFDEVKTPIDRFGKAKVKGGVAVSPLARRLIAKGGHSMEAIAAYAAVKGLRRICEDDVRAALSQASPGPAAPRSGSPAPLSSIRQKTAERLAENWRNIPHVFQAVEADFTAIDRARTPVKDTFRESQGFSLTYLPFIARAVCLALRDFPNINATFDGKALDPKRDVNLGIAVDLSHKGLVVPVVRQAGDLNVAGLAKAIARLSERARDNRLSADDLNGGTYSITNNGAFGTLFTAPIINAPQVAILSTDAIRRRPMVVSTSEGDFVAPRMAGFLGQSFDHRAFDGAYAASFLSRLKTIIETHDWPAEVGKQ